SLKSAFHKDGVTLHEELWFYHEGNRALRQGDWKIIRSNVKRPFPWGTSTEAATESINAENWSLYHLTNDRAEQNDLAKLHPERVKTMAAQWAQLVERFNQDANHGAR
ncbi:MAG TPA: arylsulfatase, partial [Verrucomicrobiales bacterium]|nr:arylsulfatase [Verrucomicrobiales bacterium]